MPTDKHIKNYSAADIEKYWNGELTASEMHALEKTAMDDPFLADALEGYKNTDSSRSELSLLSEKIDRRIRTAAPVIYLKRKRSAWLRVAAAVIIICGLGLLADQLVFKTRESPLAESKKTDAAKSEITTDNKQINPDSLNSVASTLADTLKLKPGEKIVRKTEKVTANSFTAIDTLKNDGRTAGNLKVAEDKRGVTSTSSPSIANEEKKEEGLAKTEREKANTDSVSIANKSFAPQAKAKSNQSFAELNKNQDAPLNNRYNYRVVDGQNNPVPFANVMNTRDNVGTYTDIQGMFNLLSSDSVLDIQIKSLGYTSSNYRLVPSKLPGELVLKEDADVRQRVLANNRKAVSSMPRKDSADLEEPEVGWGYYDTYVANNIHLPDKIRNKNNSSGEVELSFDIDKTGQPVNIRVTRSSQCKECDEEAIRLLKEGPKWNRKRKKSKGSVTISVDK